jgi:leukotriene-A4 hydrolase
MPTSVGSRKGASLQVFPSALLAAWALVALAGCAGAVRTTPEAPGLAASEPHVTDARNWPDPYSYTDPEAYVTRHYSLDLDVDFDARRLRGIVTLELDRHDPEARVLVLDTRDLAIDSVEVAVSGSDRFHPASFRVGPADPRLGAPLQIRMPARGDRVRIRYQSSPAASGLQWLAPEQTLGKRAPYLYSQAQALHARSFVPLQDTPRIRSTYDATLRVPAGLVAVMAAEPDAGNRRGGTGFRYRMPQPIPSYLLALAVGDLEFRALGPRTGVWAEPAQLDAAAEEFADVEAMLRQTESLWGPYRWGRYDVLVLPPSFPFGGMENPRLTFMTPTVIAGDKSLVGVLAHELAHSWSGNLVTNATWRDGWLNEGFTTYFERRIMEAVYGDDRARMEWGVGLQDLRRSLQELGPDDRWRSALAPDPQGRRSGDGGGSVAYEKGALFLYQLERAYGREALDAFLQRWFEEHAFTSVTTPDFVRQLQRDLVSQQPGRLPPDFLRRWIDEPGLPEDAVLVRSDAFERVDVQREAWQQGRLDASQLETARWAPQEWLQFLDGLEGAQPVARLQELDRHHGLTTSHNAEIAHAWFRVAIASGYPGIEADLERYLVEIGRLKLVRPLYVELMRTAQGAEFARRVYAMARPGYHSIAQRSLDRVVQ